MHRILRPGRKRALSTFLLEYVELPFPLPYHLVLPLDFGLPVESLVQAALPVEGRLISKVSLLLLFFNARIFKSYHLGCFAVCGLDGTRFCCLFDVVVVLPDQEKVLRILLFVLFINYVVYKMFIYLVVHFLKIRCASCLLELTLLSGLV